MYTINNLNTKKTKFKDDNLKIYYKFQEEWQQRQNKKYYIEHWKNFILSKDMGIEYLGYERYESFTYYKITNKKKWLTFRLKYDI